MYYGDKIKNNLMSSVCSVPEIKGMSKKFQTRKLMARDHLEQGGYKK